MRVIIVDSDERRAYEEAMRVKSMERTRQALEKLQRLIAAGKLKQPEKIGAAAERLLQRSHGYRYYSWEIHQGGFRYFENAAGLGSEKGIEGKYVIATSESGLSVLEVVAIYNDLSDVERGFRQLKDVLAMRPIYHQIEARVKAHVFVAALALLVQAAGSPARGGGDRLLGGAGDGGATDSTLGDVSHGGSTGASRGQRGLPGRAPGPEGIEADGFEAAYTPRGGGNRDVVTIRKIESCPPRGYVDAPQTWAIIRAEELYFSAQRSVNLHGVHVEPHARFMDEIEVLLDESVDLLVDGFPFTHLWVDLMRARAKIDQQTPVLNGGDVLV